MLVVVLAVMAFLCIVLLFGFAFAGYHFMTGVIKCLRLTCGGGADMCVFLKQRVIDCQNRIMAKGEGSKLIPDEEL